MRCHACCSSSRSARLRSAKTSRWCGLPSRRNVDRRSSAGRSRARTAGRAAAASRRRGSSRGAGLRFASEQPLRAARRAAARPPDSPAPADGPCRRRTPRRQSPPSRSASSAVDSTASVRCRCSVSPSALISTITRSTALPRLRAGAANRVVPFAQRAEQVRLEVAATRVHHLVGDARGADPDAAATSAVSVQRTSKLYARSTSGRAAPARPAARRRCVSRRTTRSRLRWLRGSRTRRTCRSPAIHGRHTAAAADRARCGSCRAAAPPSRTSPPCRARTFSMKTRSASSSDMRFEARRRRCPARQVRDRRPSICVAAGSAISTARSTLCPSSRTLPGHRCAMQRVVARRGRSRRAACGSAPRSAPRKCAASGAMSSRRSRSGGR